MSRLKELRQYVDKKLNKMEDEDKRTSAIAHLSLLLILQMEYPQSKAIYINAGSNSSPIKSSFISNAMHLLFKSTFVC